MTHPIHDRITSLEALHREVWDRLVRGVHDRRMAGHHPTLATVGQDGLPRARTVVLRGADRTGATLTVYTDVHSAKVSELRAQPHGALHIWDPSAHLQIRILVHVTMRSGPDAAMVWARLSPSSRMGYGRKPPSGEPIEGALDYLRTEDAMAFAILTLEVRSIEALCLGAQHRRARFDAHDAWKGQWLVP